MRKIELGLYLGFLAFSALTMNCRPRKPSPDSAVASIDVKTPSGTAVHFIDGDLAYRYLCKSSSRSALRTFAAIKSSPDCQGTGQLAAADLDVRLSEAYLKSVSAAGDSEAQLNTFEASMKKKILKCLETVEPCDPTSGSGPVNHALAKQMHAWLAGLMDNVFDVALGSHPQLLNVPASASAAGVSGGTILRGGLTMTLLAQTDVGVIPGAVQQVVLPMGARTEVNYLAYWLNDTCAEATVSMGWIETIGGKILAGPGNIALVSPGAVLINETGTAVGSPLTVSSLSLVVNSDAQTEVANCTLTVAGRVNVVNATGGAGPDFPVVQAAAVESNPVRLGVQFAELGTAIRIVSIESGSLAERSGFAVGDVINTLGGFRVQSVNDYLEIMRTLQSSGAPSAVFSVFRGVAGASVTVVLIPAGGDGGTTPPPASSFRLGVSWQPVADGLQITAVVADGNAAKKGMVVGDVLTKANNADIRTFDDYFNAVAAAQADNLPLKVVIRRGQQLLQTSFDVGAGAVTPPPVDPPVTPPVAAFRIGVSLTEIGNGTSSVVSIETVISGGMAERKGLLRGDIFLSVNGTPVTTVAGYTAAVAAAKSSGAATLDLIFRRQQQDFLAKFNFNGQEGEGGGGGGPPPPPTNPNVCTSGQSRNSVMQAFMGTPAHRQWHHLWHGIRNAWDNMSAGEQNQIGQALGSAWTRKQRDADVGEEFLQMHHVMLGMVQRHLEKNGCKMYAGWTSPPMDGDSQATVFDRSVPAGGGQSRMAQWHATVNSSATMTSTGLGAYGDFIESSLHNSMHMRHADPSMADPAFNVLPDFFNLPSSPSHRLNVSSQNYLGIPYASHVNPYFWGLHGYVDGLLLKWLQANGYNGIAGENGCSGNCYRWRRPWAGAVPGQGPSASLSLAGEGAHGTHGMIDTAALPEALKRAIAHGAQMAMFPGTTPQLGTK